MDIYQIIITHNRSWTIREIIAFAVVFLMAVFLAAALGNLFTYCVTSIQLAFAYPSEAGGVGASAVKFLGVFAPTQIPLAVIEGILTVVIVIGLETYAKPELRSIGFFKNKKGETQDE